MYYETWITYSNWKYKDFKYLSSWEIDEIRNEAINKRCCILGQYIIDRPYLSIRKIAKEFCLSKSQVHRDLTNIKHIDIDMYDSVRRILKNHRKGIL